MINLEFQKPGFVDTSEEWLISQAAGLKAARILVELAGAVTVEQSVGYPRERMVCFAAAMD